MVASGDVYRTVESGSVHVWWLRETVAILDDYSEWCQSDLPADEHFTVLEVEDQVRCSAVCRVHREQELIDKLIPRKMQNRFLMFRLPTPYRVEVRLSDIAARCIGPLESI